MSTVRHRSVRIARPVASSPAVAGFRPAGAALAVAAAFVLQPLAAQAQPSGAQVIHGQASFARNGNTLSITTQNGAGTNHSAINWQSFSVPTGSVTHFHQPSATSTSINRVMGPDPSAIYGTLSSNGRLVLVNPSGIAVGPGAVVDTGGFTASTLKMSDADALAGRLRFGGNAGGLLQVDGRIVARNGDVVLIAPKVQTGAGALVESNGSTILAAGGKVEITGRGLEGIHMEVQAGNEAVNLGTLKGDAVGIFAQTLKHSGLVQAEAVTAEGGKVVLKAIGGDALVDGRIVAAGPGYRGGSVDVLGNRVALLAGASVEVSGQLGGGQVRIGGDYQGANAAVPNARRTYVDANARISADAIVGGDGGRVIVWADGDTRMHGQISARGGAGGGDGGFAEVSGKEHLAFTGRADLRAPKGRNGTLLLDPNDLVIEVTGPTDTSVSTGSTFSSTANGTSKIKESDLEAQLALSDVLVMTNPSATGGTGLITVADGVNVEWANNNTLGLQADGSIDLQGSFTNTAGTATLSLHAINGNITQNSATSVINLSYLQVNADNGAVALEGNNLVDVVGIQASGGTNGASFKNAQSVTIGSVGSAYGATAVGIIAAGDVKVSTTAGDIQVLPGNDVTGANVTLDAAQDLQIQTATVSASGDMTLKAGRDVIVGTVAAAATTSTTVYAGGKLLVQSGRDVVASNGGSPNAAYAYFYGGGGLGKGIDFQVGRDAQFNQHTSLQGNSSPVKVVATGSILGSVFVGTDGSASADGLEGAVTLVAQTGNVQFGTISTYGNFSSPHGGNVTVTAANGTVSGGQISAQGYGFGSAGGGDGGRVDVTAGGTIDLGYVYSYGGSHSVAAGKGGMVTLVAGSGITVEGIDVSGGSGEYFSSAPGPGGMGGTISVTANSGDIDIGYALLQGGGGAGGAKGGDITVTASAGNVRIETIDASGGYSQTSAPAGNGGKVVVAASGDITLAPQDDGESSTFIAIRSDGGDNYDGQAGNGGRVELKAGGNIVLVSPPLEEEVLVAAIEAPPFTAVSVSAVGGWGMTAGTGGSVVAEAGGSMNMGLVEAYGGAGSAGAGGAGGQGGDVTLRFGNAITDTIVVAGGGQGDYGTTGGTGGKGGTIKLERTGSGDMVLDDTVWLVAEGGQGGDSTANGGTAGAGGQGGSIELLASAGRVVLRSPIIVAEGGEGGTNADATATGAKGALGTLAAMGTSVEVEAPFMLNAIWNNSSNVHIRGAAVTGNGTFRNLSDLFLYGAASINVSLGVENKGRLTSFGDNLVNLTENHGTVEVVAGSRLSTPGFLSNKGTLKVDGRLETGTPSTPSEPPSEVLSAVPTVSGATFVNESTGVLTGNGTIAVDNGNGLVNNFGTINAGSIGGTGTLTIEGALAMQSGSTLGVDLESTTNFDVVKVTGTAATGGTVAVNLLPGGGFLQGDSFAVIQAGSLDASTLPAVNKPELTAAASGSNLVLVAQAAVLPGNSAETMEVGNQVVQFANLFVQESEQQRLDEVRENRIGRDDIVVTDTSCLPR